MRAESLRLAGIQESAGAAQWDGKCASSTAFADSTYALQYAPPSSAAISVNSLPLSAGGRTDAAPRMKPMRYSSISMKQVHVVLLEYRVA